MSHIEKRRNLWYATLKVTNKELQAKLGKTKFLQSLGTPDKRRAEALAAPIVSMWKAQLRKAAGDTDAVVAESMRLRQIIQEAEDSGNEDGAFAVASLVTDKARALEVTDEAAAERFADIAFGRKTPSSEHLDEWKGSITHLAQKTQDQMAKDVQRLVDRFPMLEDITPAAARRWVSELQKAGAPSSSVERMISFWRSYWRYLAGPGVEAVAANTFPFSTEYVQKTKKAPEEERAPFPAEEVPKLWRAAEERGDQVLADLIRLGAYTGARIEELCSLKVTEVNGVSFKIADAKTAAGIREVPIHSALKPLMDRLKAASTDGYILSGLTFNKYEGRSNAIGKRFGRLKERRGFGRAHVFHSLRGTLVTLLEDAGVSENLAADIVGHEKPRITYGLYSGGASLATKAAALELVKYPGL
ncbi:MAG: phage integrase family protein [Ramlibacter sp.]|nr:phage integrase family protein [Ramlibacter sp.]